MSTEIPDQLFLDGVLVGQNELVTPGIVAVVLDDDSVHDVPASELRRRCEALGRARIRAFLMAPADFEKVRPVAQRHSEEAGKDEE
ncbi:hypothetical protein ACMDCR_29170 [Labrys okinawensis]|uniref:hypothetical protein n=1 Tax=Labrys okinawensis TaxID=346911 RepID=UPI0039BC62DC